MGDVEMPPGEIERALHALEDAVYAVASAGAVPLVLGGDHSIALPDATGVARHLGFGRVSMIHFDAHADTGDIEFGSLYGHGQPMRRLIESGALRGDRFLQIGLRGYWPGPETMKWMAEQDMRSYEMTEIGKRGLDACLDEAFEIALDECDAVFLSVDIDVCDPGHAPGHRHPGAGRAVVAAAARRRTPDLPRAAGRRHRRGRGVAALRPRRDHGVPREPGLPRGAVRAGRPQGRDHPRPGRPAAGRTLMATLFTGGSVFDGHRHLPGHGLLVDDGKVVAVLEPGWSRGRSTGAATTSSTWPAAWSRPASPTPTATRSRAAWSGCSAT